MSYCRKQTLAVVFLSVNIVKQGRPSALFFDQK